MNIIFIEHLLYVWGYAWHFLYILLIFIPSHPSDVVSTVPVLQKRKESERSSNLNKVTQ